MKKLLCTLLVLCMCMSVGLLFASCEEEPDVTPQPEPEDKEEVLLNGIPLTNYKIIYPAGDDLLKEAAESLADALKTKYSCALPSSSDAASTAEHEILLGNIDRDTSSVQSEALTKDDYQIAPLGKKIWLSGGSLLSLYKCIDDFVASFVQSGNDLCMNLSAPKRGSDASYSRVMTYNVLASTNHTNRDLEKINMVLDLIEKYEPDIFGVQEATPNWMSSLRDRFGDRYDSVGVGRYKDGSGEASAIFYLKDEYELLDSGTRWLSETPDVPGSRSFGSQYVRIYTWAKLKEKSTGKIFLHANTHLDLDDYACEMQAELLMEELQPYRDAGIPVILTGDFNCRSYDLAYQIINDKRYGAMKDSLNEAEHKRNNADGMIDHIFLTDEVKALYYQVCTEKFARANGEVIQPSDHKPVFIDCVLP